MLGRTGNAGRVEIHEMVRSPCPMAVEASLAVVNDITERRPVGEAAAPLHLKNGVGWQLAAAVSHDFNNILTCHQRQALQFLLRTSSATGPTVWNG